MEEEGEEEGRVAGEVELKFVARAWRCVMRDWRALRQTRGQEATGDKVQEVQRSFNISAIRVWARRTKESNKTSAPAIAVSRLILIGPTAERLKRTYLQLARETKKKRIKPNPGTTSIQSNVVRLLTSPWRYGKKGEVSLRSPSSLPSQKIY